MLTPYTENAHGHGPLQFGFADSEVARVVEVVGADRRVRIQFAVACLAPLEPARPREDAWFYAPGVTLVLSGCAGADSGDAVAAQNLSSAVGRLIGGLLHLDGERQPVLGLTMRWAGEVRLQMDFRNGTCLQVRAAAMHFELDGAIRTFESLAC